MIQWQDLLVACGLLLVLEGVLPSLYPRRWKALIAWGAGQTPRTVRGCGLLSMAAGAMLLIWVRG